MAWVAAVGSYIGSWWSGLSAASQVAVVSTAVSTVAADKQGRDRNKLAGYESDQLEASAKTETAKAQRIANEERRRARITQSRANAVAAGGGGNTSDVGILDLTSDLAADGEYNALTALWNGSEASAGRRMSAAGRRLEGKDSRNAGRVNALNTAIRGYRR